MKLIILLLVFNIIASVHAIKVVKMLEDLESVNKPTLARVNNFDLEQLPEITICIRVYFYHFPVQSEQDLKWFPILSSSQEGSILFNVVAFDSGKKSGDLYQAIPKRIYHSKDLKNLIFLNRKFTRIR